MHGISLENKTTWHICSRCKCFLIIISLILALESEIPPKQKTTPLVFLVTIAPPST